MELGDVRVRMLSQIEAIDSEEALNEVRVSLLGKKGVIPGLLGQLRSATP
jgi:hypothetical protein